VFQSVSGGFRGFRGESLQVFLVTKSIGYPHIDGD